MALYIDLGRTAYRDCYMLQQRLVAARVEKRLQEDCFLLTEHPPVFTLGRRGGREHLHVSEEILAERGVDLVPIERGGEITYHGPGQLVLYPIIALRERKLRVAEYVGLLEEAMIRLAGEYGVVAERNCANPGVWTPDGRSKIGSIGIAIRHGVSYHGLACNVVTDLTPFGWINPCGLAGVSASSIAKELGQDISYDGAKSRFFAIVEDVFGPLRRQNDLSELERL